ncbi:hypothetical protein OE88DRAFT_1725728 [Heliocybe sulcata]|uniref:Uncharacterized protein n=1 Tax=Heliocybe sulcata TaxID=5364 RepID=A0A5C3NBU0_9AGAM|nr:hypothetical protein OE88DRAFT_1725728 [Heliocybe sulcata]
MSRISDSIFEAGITSMLPPAPFYTSTTVNGAFQDSRRSRFNPHADEFRPQTKQTTNHSKSFHHTTVIRHNSDDNEPEGATMGNATWTDEENDEGSAAFNEGTFAGHRENTLLEEWQWSELRGELNSLPDNEEEGQDKVSRFYSDIPRASWEHRKLEGSGETLDQDLSPVFPDSHVPALETSADNEEQDDEDSSTVVAEDSGHKGHQSYAAVAARSLKKQRH